MVTTTEGIPNAVTERTAAVCAPLWLVIKGRPRTRGHFEYATRYLIDGFRVNSNEERLSDSVYDTVNLRR